MKRKILLLSFVASTSIFSAVNAQMIAPSTLNATGGYRVIGGNTYEYSVGEMALVNTMHAPNLMYVTNGILQPETGVTFVQDEVLNQQLNVYPNPANTIVNLEFNSPKEGDMTIRLMDMAGQIILTEKNTVKQGLNKHQIDMTSVAAATYLLEVNFSANGAENKTTSYKIQKLQ